MGNLIDRYVFGARVGPIAVVAFSLFLAVSAWIPFAQWPVKLLGGSVFFALGMFVLAHLARDAGKAIEDRLWASWGGRPTVRMLRHRDPTIASGSKALLHRRLVELGIVDRLPSEVEERERPEHADEIYLTCSDWLRRKALELKFKTPFDIVHSENISYGYQRNILGIKPYGLRVWCIASAFGVTAFLFGREPYIEICIISAIGAYLILLVNEGAVKRAADEYAKRLFDAALTLPIPSARSPKHDSGAKALGI